MPFGLTNTPAIIQRIVNKQLYKYLNIFVVAYLDNILIFSKSKSKYIKYIKRVLEKLKGAGILLKPKKYKFYKEELEFLRFIIGRNSIQINPKKVKVILE